MFILSRGIYDADDKLLATVSIAFDIGVLDKIIESSLNSEFKVDYEIYDPS